jgi:MoxR-like ATPase
LQPLLDRDEVLALRAETSAVRVATPIKEYAVDVVRATRDPEGYGLGLAPLIELGASPRATLALVKAAQGHALLSGRDYVTPHDVKRTALEVLRHRVVVSYEADAEGLSSDGVLTQILDRIRVP